MKRSGMVLRAVAIVLLVLGVCQLLRTELPSAYASVSFALPTGPYVHPCLRDEG
jgi:hypothetical protein